MDRKFFHGNIRPIEIAHALIAAFNRGNLRAQSLGEDDKVVVQIATKPNAMSGGQMAISVNIQAWEDGVMVEMGESAWLGVAASLGASAFAVLTNPLSLLGRLDDIAQDLESLQISESIWQVILQTAEAAGVSTEISEKIRRVVCDYCGSANPTGEPSCVACGAPLGKAQPTSCPNCGYILEAGEAECRNCHRPL